MRVDGAGRHPGRQLGVHGDDISGVEPESVVGALAERNAGAMVRALPRREGDGAGHGIQDVRERVYADAVPDRSHRPAIDLSPAELESLAIALLPDAVAIALLTDCY